MGVLKVPVKLASASQRLLGLAGKIPFLLHIFYSLFLNMLLLNTELQICTQSFACPSEGLQTEGTTIK